MILTYKLKHHQDFSEPLAKARQVAEFGIKHKTLSSKDVKQFGLKSMIANQVLRKYAKNKNIKRVTRVNLTIPNQGIKVDKSKRLISLPCLKFEFAYHFPNTFEKVNHIEINSEYVFVSVTVANKSMMEPDNWVGVDLNTTGHVAVVGNPETGKVIKLGKKAQHTHLKYKNIRKNLQKSGHYKTVKSIKNREKRIVRDLNQKVSTKIVQVAKDANTGIKLEQLEGIRQNAKTRKSFKYSLNSWSFYQLKTMIEYKANLQGIPVAYVDPRHTSKECSRCGLIGNRQGKVFKCSCEHVDHADANASFNIALRPAATVNCRQTEMSAKGKTQTGRSQSVRRSGRTTAGAAVGRCRAPLFENTGTP